MTAQEAIMGHPAQGNRVQQGAKLVTAVDVHHTQPEPTKGKVKESYDARVQKEIALAEAWVRAKSIGPNAKLWETKPQTSQIREWVLEQLKQFRGY